MRGVMVLGLLVLLLALVFAALELVSRCNATRPASSSACNSVATCRSADARTPWAGLPTAPADDPTGAFPKSDPAPVLEPRHVPDHGPQLQRGGAIVAFRLEDSAGTRVRAADCEAILWRKVGGGWVRDVAAPWDGDLLLADGVRETSLPGSVGVGLEPGEYEIEICSEFWGCIRHAFSVAGGDRREVKLVMPATRRVMPFRFQHADGTPVSHLRAAPELWGCPPGLPEVPRPAPGRVELGVVDRGFSTCTGCRFPRRQPVQHLRTDFGRVWVEVFDGTHHHFIFKLNTEVWGLDEYIYDGDLTGAPEVLVTLPTPPDFAARVAAYGPECGADDPGCQSLRWARAVVAPAAPDPLADPVPDGRMRLVVEVQGPVPVTVFAGPAGKEVALRQEAGLHWGHFARGSELQLSLRDNFLLLTDWERLPSSDIPLLHVVRHVPGPLARIHDADLPPTLRAFAGTVALEVTCNSHLLPAAPLESSRCDSLPRPACCEPCAAVLAAGQGGRELLVPLGGSLVEALPRCDIFVRTRISGPCGWEFPDRMACPVDAGLFTPPGAVCTRWRRLDPAGLQGLLSGGIQPDAPGVLAFRAVGSQGEGLPDVQGVVYELDADREAAMLRAALARGDAKPPRSGPAMAWYREHRTWFDPKRRLAGDCHGYCVTDAVELTPGRSYVLYLWSRSCNRNAPDLRVVFDAAETTDLGVLRLPSP